VGERLHRRLPGVPETEGTDVRVRGVVLPSQQSLEGLQEVLVVVVRVPGHQQPRPREAVVRHDAVPRVDQAAAARVAKDEVGELVEVRSERGIIAIEITIAKEEAVDDETP